MVDIGRGLIDGLFLTMYSVVVALSIPVTLATSLETITSLDGPEKAVASTLLRVLISIINTTRMNFGWSSILCVIGRCRNWS